MNVTPIKSCSICDELHNNESGLFYSNLRDKFRKMGIKSRILYEDSQFVVMPSLGAISACHLLILPKQHVSSFALLDDDLLNLAEMVIQKVAEIIREKYGGCVVFEHGTLNDKMLSSASCNHAHMHIVSCSQSIISLMEKDGLVMREINKLSELRDQVKREKPYLYYFETNGQAFVMDDIIQTSQYMRILIANELGRREKGDWKSNFGISEVKQMILEMGGELRKL